MNGHVVVIGAGFGGLQCARSLARTPFEVVLIDRNDYHLFTPLLYQVASSLLNPSDIGYPVRSVFRGVPNVRYRMGDVTRVDLARRLVHPSDGPAESYDRLVIATGASVNFFGQDAIAAASHTLGDLPNALELRNHVLRCFEAASTTADPAARATWLTFVIVGGGPTGVEYAGALAELIRLVAGRDYSTIGRESVRMVLLEGQDELLPAFPVSLGAHARGRLTRFGIDVRVGTRVEGVRDETITLDTGERLDARTLVWAAGVQPSGLVRSLEVAKRQSGRIAVDAYLAVPGCIGVYAIGDAAGCIEGAAELPMLSAPAMQQGRRVARNFLREARGQAPRPFRYRDKGIMATIGRHAGVAKFGRLALRGFPGWVAWLVVHLYFIIGFRNRFAVLSLWAWNYFLHDRPIRFVVRAAPPKT